MLGLLSQEELSGYEITKRFEQSVGYFWHARSQQIYPELARLEGEGLVTGRMVEQVGRPHKRLFQITPAGSELLREWVITASPPTFVKDEFMLKVWCYGLVDPRDARTAVAEQRVRHEERLASYRAIASNFESSDQAGLPPEYFGAFLTLQGGIAMEEAFVAWCQRVEELVELRAQANGG